MAAINTAEPEVTFHLEQDEVLNTELNRIASQYPGFVRVSFTGRLHAGPKGNLTSFTIQAWYEDGKCIGAYGYSDLAAAISVWYVALEKHFYPAIAA